MTRRTPILSCELRESWGPRQMSLIIKLRLMIQTGWKIVLPTTHDTKLRPRKTASFNDHYNERSFTKRSIAGCFTSAKSALFSSRYKPLSVRRYRSPRIALAEKEANERSENVLPPISRSLLGSNSGSSCLQKFPLDTGGSPSLDDSKSISSTVEPISNRHESLPEPRFWSHNLYKGPGSCSLLPVTRK
jgi:hypothetical protein